jgi:hypothetical protein
VTYTLPLSLRKNLRTFIASSVILLLITAFPLYYLVTTNILDDPAIWMMFFLLAAFFGFIFLSGLSNEIRLTEDRVSCRESFFSKEMEYTRITAVRFYIQYSGKTEYPILELSGDSGTTITINLGLFDSPANRWIIYDVLKKKATRAGINKSMEEFFTDPYRATPWRRSLLPGPYRLPLTLRMSLGTFVALSVLFLPSIGILIFSPWMPGPPLGAGIGLLYLNTITQGIRLTEDRISYRKWFFSKGMEFQRITAVRYYYYQNTWAFWNWGPVLELSGDSGDTITMKFGTLINPEHLPVIYDVLRKNAIRADLRNSPEEFFAHPNTMAGN